MILPHYLNDLNAMHEAEKVLTFTQREVYFRFLIGPLPFLKGVTLTDAYWQVSHATAAQRAEAFLRTIGKWAPEKPSKGEGVAAPRSAADEYMDSVLGDEKDAPIMQHKYSIQDKNQLLDLLMKCQAGEMTCLRAIEYIEPQVDELIGALDSKMGVLDAIDRTLDGTTNEEQLARFQKGFIHASRAIAIKNIHVALAAAQSEITALRQELSALKADKARDSARLEGGELLSLIDGAKSVVEIWQPSTPAQIKWKEEWLKNTRAQIAAAMRPTPPNATEDKE